MVRIKLFYRVAAVALFVAAGPELQARAERNGAAGPGVTPAVSSAAFQLTFPEQPPAVYVPNSKFTKPADNTQAYNYADLPAAAQGAGLAGKEKSCVRFLRNMEYGGIDAASGEGCAKGCEEIFKHDPGVGPICRWSVNLRAVRFMSAPNRSPRIPRHK